MAWTRSDRGVSGARGLAPAQARRAAAGSTAGGTAGSTARALAVMALGLMLAGCDGNYAPRDEDDSVTTAGPPRQYDRDGPTIFGEGGLNVGTIGSTTTGLFGEEGTGDRLPVNKYLWQAALDTLSFLPLASTDPFTGVIATEWGSTPDAPGERFKVSAFVTSPALSAASLKVAVYREVRNEDGDWIPAAVDPETPRKLEDAILTRAREIRIAEREGRAAS